MAACIGCGAPLTFARAQSIECPFCGVPNDPPPKEVVVPVPVKVVNQVVQVVTADGSPAPVELRCPLCRKRLVTVEASGVELNGCGGCGGIWVDNDNARILIAAPQRVFMELAVNAGKNATTRRRGDTKPVCPLCPAALDRVMSHGIELDVCAEHGTWFDAFELRTLTETLIQGAKAKAARPTGKVACVACQQPIDATRANIGENGPTCDSCWRKRQEELADTYPSVANAALQMLEATKDAAGTVATGVGGAVLLGAVVGGLGADDHHHHHHHRRHSF